MPKQCFTSSVKVDSMMHISSKHIKRVVLHTMRTIYNSKTIIIIYYDNEEYQTRNVADHRYS